jgi:hypothetical protein
MRDKWTYDNVSWKNMIGINLQHIGPGIDFVMEMFIVAVKQYIYFDVYLRKQNTHSGPKRRQPLLSNGAVNTRSNEKTSNCTC